VSRRPHIPSKIWAQRQHGDVTGCEGRGAHGNACRGLPLPRPSLAHRRLKAPGVLLQSHCCFLSARAESALLGGAKEAAQEASHDLQPGTSSQGRRRTHSPRDTHTRLHTHTRFDTHVSVRTSVERRLHTQTPPHHSPANPPLLPATIPPLLPLPPSLLVPLPRHPPLLSDSQYHTSTLTGPLIRFPWDSPGKEQQRSLANKQP